VTRERLALGRLGERLAREEIRKLGYNEVARNYRCPLGEVDLIARDRDTLVFIEIKTRSGGPRGYAKEAVDRRKQRQLSKAALYYMKEHGVADERARFDVVAVSFRGGEPEIELIRNAFDLAC